MATRKHWAPYPTGWRGIGLLATTYIYFLIFAQFGFLKSLSSSGFDDGGLKRVMGAMALGGILTSLAVARLEGRMTPTLRLRLGFFGCSLSALLSTLPMTSAGAMAIAGMIGVSLGIVTVTLVTHLRQWLGRSEAPLKIGGGVGFAYFVCNCPVLFQASPRSIALFSVLIGFMGMLLPGNTASLTAEHSESTLPPLDRNGTPPFWLALAAFTALVWLDSAAFFIIQSTPALKAGTWEGAHRLWQIGGIHWIAALASGYLLKRGGFGPTLTLAFAFLAGACLLLTDPSRAPLASLLYPIGVSLYSVALVAYPASAYGTETLRMVSARAGRLYAIAGWMGSGLGIGMGENLRHVPPAFVAAAATLFILPMVLRWCHRNPRQIITTSVLLLCAWGIHALMGRGLEDAGRRANLSPIEMGRQVYIAEGCIHCHSQYVRPGSQDEVGWGAASDVEQHRSESPPLIGDRRQGPDLAEVGHRRSPLWLEAHFIDPRELSPESPMPSYAHLFKDERGPALIAYLQSLGGEHKGSTSPRRWHLPESGSSPATQLDGSRLLQKHCSTCHSSVGSTQLRWKNRFRRPPPDLAQGPYVYVPAGLDPAWRLQRIAELVKFGLVGTDMPGHEYLSDDLIGAMAAEVVRISSARKP